MIETTEMKAGYKITKLGWIPEEWDEIAFNNVFGFAKTYAYSRKALKKYESDTDIFNIHYGDIHSKFNCNQLNILNSVELIPTIMEPRQDYDFLKDGDLVIADASEDYEGICACIELNNLKNLKVTGGLHTFIARDLNGKTVAGYRSYIFKNAFVANELKRISTGTSVYGVSKSNLGKMLIPLPPLPEQKKIADILSTWDKAIETTQALVHKLKLRKKGLMQQLLTGKKRLPGFEEEWEVFRMEEVTENFSKRNKKLINARVYSVTNNRGFIYQTDMFSREVAGKDLTGYKIISKNEFAYNPARVNVGSIALFKNEVGIISSLYVCFRTNQNLLDSYLEYLLETHEFKFNIERYGEGGVRIYLWYYLFKHIKMKLPTVKEQTAIAKLLNKSDEEINQRQNYLDQLQAQKKGLMQQLLTGQKRVIV